MKLLTIDAKITCKHVTGVAQLVTRQSLVRINHRPVMVRRDPEFKPITGCANLGPTIKPCTATMTATEGYSSFVRINGRPICLDTISGMTDGTPPGTIKYVVQNPGQTLITVME